MFNRFCPEKYAPQRLDISHGVAYMPLMVSKVLPCAK
jgi:CRISPR-associated DxTHG motif protein